MAVSAFDTEPYAATAQLTRQAGTNKRDSDEPDRVLEEDLRSVRRRLGVAAVVAHEADADALVDDDSCSVLSVLSYEADALDEAGVNCLVVLWLFDAASSMVAPHRRSRAVHLSARLAYGSHRS